MKAPMSTLELQQKLAAANSKPPSEPPPPSPVVPLPRSGNAVGRQTPASDSGRENKTHIGAWLHRDFKRSLLLLRAQTGDDVQTIIARALNAEFRAHNVPVVEG